MEFKLNRQQLEKRENPDISGPLIDPLNPPPYYPPRPAPAPVIPPGETLPPRPHGPG